MTVIINVKELRARLAEVVRRTRRGERFTVIYRSRPAFNIMPVDDHRVGEGDLEADPLYRAEPLGSSDDGRAAADHDRILYR